MQRVNEEGARQALILAPLGRDAAVAKMLLEEAAVPGAVCNTYLGFCQSLSDDILFAVLSEEALLGQELSAIESYVKNQPSWSSLPFIMLTHRMGGPAPHPEASRLGELLQNVTLIERPFHAATFVSVVKSTLRARLRQFEARAAQEALSASEDALKSLNQNLEQRVAERTAELERAHALVLEEVAQREQAEKELRQAQKMEALGQFTGGVAHDFNNLLMAVMSNLELLTKHLKDDARALRLVNSAMQGAKRGAALTQRLLAFGRRQDLKIEVHDIGALVISSLDLLHRSIPADIELELDLKPSGAPALIDRNQFELALLNLVLNARDALPQGGTIQIRVDVVPAEEPEDRSGSCYVRLTVADNGHGMDEATRDQAMQPFFSTKEVGKGTGLGLSMVHGLALQLGGRLILSSQVGSGTVVELWLPASAAESVPHPEDTTAPPPTDEGPKLRILFVDDDVLIAMSSVEMLEDLGHEVVQANSGAQALAYLEKGNAVDVMITDFSMPKMNGMQLATAARELRPELPILLATGYAELPDGADTSIPKLDKPYCQWQLQEELRKLRKQEPQDIPQPASL